MEKMSLSDFRMYHSKIQKIVEYSEQEENASNEDQNKIIAEYNEIFKKLSEYDLSDIDFEEWNGILIYPEILEDTTIDLSNTHANLDFSLIKYEVPKQVYGNYMQVKSNFKGCKIKNFNFDDCYYDEDTFDADFIEANRKYFLDSEIFPEDIVKKYYCGNITLYDLQKYPNLMDVIDERNLSYYIRQTYNSLGRDEFSKLDFEFLSTTDYWSINKIKNLDGQKNAEEIMDYLYGEARKDFLEDVKIGRERLYVDRRKLGDEFRRRNEDLYISEDVPERVRDNYYTRSLILNQVVENISYFKDKEIAGSCQENAKKIIDLFGKDFIPIFTEYRDAFLEASKNDHYIFYNFEIPEDKTSEEKTSILKGILTSRIKFDGELDTIIKFSPKIDLTSRVTNEKVKKILKIISPEELKAHGYTNINELEQGIFDVDLIVEFSKTEEDIKTLTPKNIIISDEYPIGEIQKKGIKDLHFFLEDHTINLEKLNEELKTIPAELIPFGSIEKKQFILKYGIENILRLDRETDGLFSHQFSNDDTFLNILASQERKDKKLGQIEDLSYEEFKKTIYEDIKRIRGYNGYLTNVLSTSNVFYGFVKGDFRREYPDIFLPEDFEEDSAAKMFYMGKLTSDLISKNEKLQEALRYTDIVNATSGFFKFQGLTDSRGYSFGYSTKNIADYVISNFSVDEYFKLCDDYGAKLDYDNLFLNNSKMSIDELRNLIEESIYIRIKQKSETYSESLPQSFKDKHPDIFLSSDVPENIKNSFYLGKLSFDEIKANPESIKYLQDKDLKIGMSITAKSQSQCDRNQKMNILFDVLDNNQILNLARVYGNYLYGVDLNLIKSRMSDEEITEKIENSIYSSITHSLIDYGPNAPEFLKKNHPELFIDDDAPEDLKLAYYSSYIAKDGKFEGFSASKKQLTFEDLQNDEFNRYLYGKDLTVVKNKGISKLAKYFSTEELIRFSKIDFEALEIISKSQDSQIIKFRRYIDEKPEKFAISEMIETEGYTEEEIRKIIDNESNDDPRIEKGRQLLEKKKNKFIAEIVSSPGYVLNYSEDRSDDFNFKEYKELLSMSKFEVSDNYRRNVAENIISNMYEMFGYSGAKEILRLPNIEESRVEEILRNHGKKFNEVYEEKFQLQGNMKVINTFFDKYNPLFLTKKERFNAYKTINEKIENGFSGNLEELISSAFSENGIEFDPNKVKSCARLTRETNANEKINMMMEFIEGRLENDFVETAPNKKILKDLLVIAYRKSLVREEHLDIDLVGKLLAKELGRKKEDGNSFYSPHVTSHLQDLLNITQDINQEHALGKKVNMTSVDILKEEKDKIGKGWIRKLNELSNDLSKEDLDKLNHMLYGNDSEFTIPTSRHIELKDKSESGIEEAFILLKEMEYPGVFTYEKGEQMFVGLSKPFSEEFAKFFMKNKTEFLRRPEAYTKFQKINSEFDSIIQDQYVLNRYNAGKYTMSELLDAINRTVYEGVKPGEYDLEFYARKGGIEKEYFSRAQEVFHEMEKRESQTVPPIEYTGKKYRGRILRIDDPLHLAIGNVTTCCQRFGKGQPGEPSMLHSALEKNGSVFIVEEIDDFGQPKQIVSQSWTWRNGDRICFDNVEIPDTLQSELRENGGYDKVLDVYRQAAEKMIDIDRTTLKKMLKDGKISQAEYEKIVLKDVTVGTGCDDLIRSISPEEKEKLKKPSTMIRVIEGSKKYETVSGEMATPWVDSNAQQLVLAENDEELGLRKNNSVVQVPIEYKKIREVIRRSGTNISTDIVDRIQKMNEKNGSSSKSIFSKLVGKNISELYYSYEDFLDEEASLSVSYSNDNDWYIYKKESPKSIKIEETLLMQDDRKDKDSDLAKSEYETELLSIFEKANIESKYVEINPQNEYPVLNELVEEKLITVNGTRIEISDIEKIKDKRKKISEELSARKDKRIVEKTTISESHDEDER